VDIGAVDRSATRGGGPLRGAAPVSKLVALAIVLAAVLVTWNVFMLAAVFISLTAVLTLGRIDLRLGLALAAYPAFFAVVFALASAPDLMTGAVIVSKAVTAALAAVSVVLSTPYPQVFAPIQRIVPGIVGDALLMTYRSTFILLEKFSRLLRATRLRSGVRAGQPVRAAKATAGALGGLLMYSIDLAQRDYDVMRLRGYEGRLRVTPQHSVNRLFDAALLVGAGVLLATSIVLRMYSGGLNPYSWIVLLLPVLLLAAAMATTTKVSR
jgi:cobalt/nickel transport system permease protein